MHSMKGILQDRRNFSFHRAREFSYHLSQSVLRQMEIDVPKQVVSVFKVVIARPQESCREQ